MRGSVVIAVALLVLAGEGCGAAGGTGGVSPVADTSPRFGSPTPTLSQTSHFEGTVGPVGGSGAATQLAAQPRCEAAGSRTGVADLTWVPARMPGSEQLIALTIFEDGFATGSFTVSPPLQPGATSYTWQGTNPGGAHRWRVLTLHGTTWTPSDTAIFIGETCVSDSA